MNTSFPTDPPFLSLSLHHPPWRIWRSSKNCEYSDLSMGYIVPLASGSVVDQTMGTIQGEITKEVRLARRTRSERGVLNTTMALSPLNGLSSGRGSVRVRMRQRVPHRPLNQGSSHSSLYFSILSFMSFNCSRAPEEGHEEGEDDKQSVRCQTDG